jgi:hypothetical protein
MEAHRLRAPSSDGGVLAVPALSDAQVRLEANLERLRRFESYDVQGRSAARVRAMARAEALEQARVHLARFGLDPGQATAVPERLIVTGHQPELFHPGVWIKNFAVAAIARATNAAALNLIVDDDIPKGASVRVPVRSGGLLRATHIEFDEWLGEQAYEEWRVRDETLFASFGTRVRDALGEGSVRDPMIDEFWPYVLEARAVTDRIGLRFAAARRRLEGTWGVSNAEVPLSAVCESAAFGWFASHLLAHVDRFQAVHNACLMRYRAAYHIRSRHHPVPALARDGEWFEAPFWAWRGRAPRRRPLLVRPKRVTMELRIAGEDQPFQEIPLARDREACCAVEALRTLPAQGIRLRTRALTTTLFARLFLGDLFLHGIGGAKYDELGDEIARQFFGIEPPDYMTLSMTLWLGLAEAPASGAELHEVEQRLRELRFNPDRYVGALGSVPPWKDLVETKRAVIAGPVATRRQRVARFRELARCNEALWDAVATARGELETERSRLLAGVRSNQVARGRDYAFVLHSRRRFRAAIARHVPVMSPI